jgi:hypothetical protein
MLCTILNVSLSKPTRQEKKNREKEEKKEKNTSYEINI